MNQSMDRTIDRSNDWSIDREDLIICIAIWTLYKLCHPLTCDEVRVISIASLNKLRFTSLWGNILKGFGKPNGFPNSIFEAFSSMLFFIAFEHPILVDFLRLPTRKIVIIFTKSAFSIKVRKLLVFAFVFGSQNEENQFKMWIKKRVVLKHRIWRVFSRILGAFWSPKIIKKSQIFEKNDVRRRPL